MLFIILFIVFFVCLKAFKQRIRIGRTHLQIFFGVPGAGKTTIASAFASKYLRYAKKHPSIKVFSNVPIKGCYKFSCMDDLGNFQIENSLIIIDEASLEFNSRSYASFPKSAISFFKLHRHYHCEVVVFSQSWNDCDITIRRVAFQYWLVRPSLIPYVIQAVPIRRRIGINEQTNQPDDIYSFYPFLLRPFHTRNFFAPLYWKKFDSWEAPTLPEKEFSIWE